MSIEILSKYPTSCHIAKTSPSKLVKIFRRYQGCNYSTDKAKELIAAAKDSFYSGKASKSRGLCLTMKLDEIRSLSEKIADIEEETIATFIGCVGDVSRFSSVPIS